MNNGELHVVFGTGAVGSALMHELVGKGKRVRVVNRSGEADVPVGVDVVGGDAADRRFAREASGGASVVYNCLSAPYDRWPEIFPRLQAGVVEGAAAAEAKLVSVENLYMYGPTGGKPLTEKLPYAAKTRKGRTRAKMARELLNAHERGKVRVAIGRASDFFGPGVLSSAMGTRVFYPALSGKSASVMGKPDLPHTYTYVPDIAKGLVILGENDEALGQAWHLPSPETVTTREFVQITFEETGHPPKIQVASKLLVRFVGVFNPMMRELVEMLYQFEEPFVVHHGKFEQAFGNHATPLREAIRETVAWFREHPPPH